MSDRKYGLMFGAILVALGFHMWADYLTIPLQGRAAGELTSEVLGQITSSFAAIFLSVIDKPYEITEATYSVGWNLAFPLLLLLIATLLFGYILRQLVLSIFQEENTKLMGAWKGILSLLITFVLFNSVIKTFGILVLNLAVAAVVGIIFIIFLSILKSMVNSDEKERVYT
ncbi:hypothetical protein [Sporosarcina highlanderae]|uniref:DUF2975 domain-containing protein n=1 Tax=Sporosarcina highlanderae TaxID=3035916 RepID=A0ABT8JSJ5_9BACL|nr:hypothetical protein [Sporosarcina highlanderae]MDN4608085.1 hypothetical protein [Sporosarcina highlanderae]